MKIFMDNKRKIMQHNQKFVSGESTFEMAMNEFGDLVKAFFL